jgi:hypothetical protein
MSQPHRTRTAPPVPLEYQTRPRDRGRAVSPALIAVALGMINLLWAGLVMFVHFGPFPADLRGPATWMLISGLAPSTIIGTLIATIAARGTWRGPG